MSENVYFNGSSLVRLDLLRDPIASTRESIRFRFKTSNANGIVLYSRGTQGDYIALQLQNNRMVLNIDLGSRIMTSLTVGSLLDDNVWHDVVISRNRRDIIFSVDRVIIQGKLKAEFNRLNLNRAVHFHIIFIYFHMLYKHIYFFLHSSTLAVYQIFRRE